MHMGSATHYACIKLLTPSYVYRTYTVLTKYVRGLCAAQSYLCISSLCMCWTHFLDLCYLHIALRIEGYPSNLKPYNFKKWDAFYECVPFINLASNTIMLDVDAGSAQSADGCAIWRMRPRYANAPNICTTYPITGIHPRVRNLQMTPTVPWRNWRSIAAWIGWLKLFNLAFILHRIGVLS